MDKVYSSSRRDLTWDIPGEEIPYLVRLHDDVSDLCSYVAHDLCPSALQGPGWSEKSSRKLRILSELGVCRHARNQSYVSKAMSIDEARDDDIQNASDKCV
jgi:hypothetical protein